MCGGLPAHGTHRLTFDLAPAGEVGQRLRGDSAGLRDAAQQSLRVRLDILDGNTTSRPGAWHSVDVYTEFTRHAADRRRRRGWRDFR